MTPPGIFKSIAKMSNVKELEFLLACYWNDLCSDYYAGVIRYQIAEQIALRLSVLTQNHIYLLHRDNLLDLGTALCYAESPYDPPIDKWDFRSEWFEGGPVNSPISFPDHVRYDDLSAEVRACIMPLRNPQELFSGLVRLDDAEYGAMLESLVR